MHMKSAKIAESNPYLKGRRFLAEVFVRTVESSTAIEGVRLELSSLVVKPSTTKRLA